MGRPRSLAPFVVMSVRVPPDMAKRIEALGPRADVLREVIERGIASVERARAHKPQAPSPVPVPPPPAMGQFQDMAQQAGAELQNRAVAWIAAIDQQYQCGNLVPIASIRGAMPDVPPPALDMALFELERQGVVDLKLANDPSTAPPGGIVIPGRGLAWWVARR